MKPHELFLVASIFVAAAQATAGDAVKPDPKVLGTTEAILAYCAKIDPAAESKYREGFKLVTQGVSEEELSKARKSDAYREAHQSVEDFVAKTDEHQSMKACSEFLAQNR